MRSALSLIAFLLALQPLAPGRAGVAEWARSLDDVRRASEQIRSVQARFVQTKAMRLLQRPLVSRGVFAFEAPGSVRWEYLEPLRSVLLLDQGRLQRFAHRQGAWQPDAAERLEAMRVVVGEIQAWMTGRFQDSQIFEPTLEPAAAGSPARIVLRPRGSELGGLLQRVELELGERPGLIQRILLVEGPEAVTTIEFQDALMNAPLERSRFQKP